MLATQAPSSLQTKLGPCRRQLHSLHPARGRLRTHATAPWPGALWQQEG